MSDHIPDVTKMIGETPRTDAISRINEYLCVGGFFNPEIVNVQQHEAVRDTLIQARDELNAAKERIKRLEEVLESIREYWNRDNNERAMADACWHAINTASEALEAKEAKL